MPNIRLDHIDNFICHDISLEVCDKELLVLWGPTGAGKTTLLNVIAGFVQHEGTVLFDDVCVNERPVHRRKVGYLFQNLVLFPHLDVRTNIGYGLRTQGKPKDKAKSRADDLLELMKIEHLADRYPKDLSGGEKQRVALARALAPCPEIMLLDEPLNSLDFDTARYLRTQIQHLQRKLGITTIYVTHCLEEALVLADRVAVLNNGTITRIDSPENVFERPDCRMITENGYCDCYKGETGPSQLKLRPSSRPKAQTPPRQEGVVSGANHL